MFADQSNQDIVALVAVKADGSISVQDRSMEPVDPLPMDILFKKVGALRTTDMKAVAFTILQTSSSPTIIRIVINGHVYCFEYIPEQGGWVQVPCP
jgi:hypothetical protein